MLLYLVLFYVIFRVVQFFIVHKNQNQQILGKMIRFLLLEIVFVIVGIITIIPVVFGGAGNTTSTYILLIVGVACLIVSGRIGVHIRNLAKGGASSILTASSTGKNRNKVIVWSTLMLVLVVGVVIYATNKNDPYLVNTITSSTPWYDQATRINQLAIQKSDISVCEKINIWGYVDGGEKYLINQCKTTYAAAFPQGSVCLKNKGACDLSTIVNLGDPTACFQDAYCVSAVAYKKNDLNICEQFLPGLEGDKSFPATSPLYNLSPSQKCRWYIEQGTFTFPKDQ